MSLKLKLIILFLVASVFPFAIIGILIYLNNPDQLDELLFFGGLLIIFVIFLGLSLSQIVIEPIENLIKATRSVTSRNLSARVPVNSRDEVGQLARAFNKMMSELQQIDKAKTEFIILASHYLRTPLSTISWQLETLLYKNKLKLDEEQSYYLKEAYSANRRMVKLVEALLDVSQLEIGVFLVKKEPIDVKKEVAEILSDVRPKLTKKSIDVKSQIRLRKKTIMMDHRIFTVIIQNLIDNAIRYTPDNGAVSLKIDKQKGNLLISVSDTGYGIPKDEQDQIFNKLYRASNIKQTVKEGLGLGLYTVKSLLEEVNGEVWFDSQENKGTTFYVKIPLPANIKLSRKPVKNA